MSHDLFHKHQLNVEIAVLREISSAVVHEKNVSALLNKVVEILYREMGLLRGTFTLLHGNILTIEASYGLSEMESKKGKYKLGEGITGAVALTGMSCVIPDISQECKFLDRTGSRKDAKNIAFICIPVVHMEKVIGTLSIDREVKKDIDLEHDQKLLEIVANITADAVASSLAIHEEREQLMEENRRLREALGGDGNPGGLIGNCRTMQNIYAMIKQVAPSNATVLIRGSSGTGKELAARGILQLSSRNDRPFIALNCAALPENLVESELFGHEKGAFTGALTRRIGRAEAADGGTLFLDEIGDLSLPIQVKLLRFIQERTFSRVGANSEIKADVRIIAATSRNLEELMEKGLFREDLYYRLNIFPIVLPDLCRRRCDIILLAEHFIAKHNLRYGKNVKRISTPAINMLVNYHWPGNVRELENCIERAVLTATDEVIHSYNLPPSLQTGDVSGGDEKYGTSAGEGHASFNVMVNSFERELIVDALKRHGGNMSAAGRELELSPRVMHYKITRLGITPEWYKVKAKDKR